MSRVITSLLAVAVLASGCLPIPHRVPDEPELSGVLLREGEPVAGAELAFSLGAHVAGCSEGRALRTDAAGRFHFSATRDWAAFLLLTPVNHSGRWVVCRREGAETPGWAVLYRGFGYRGTREHILCDLTRTSSVPVCVREVHGTS